MKDSSAGVGYIAKATIAKLGNRTEGVALLVSGQWGAGKTHLWKNSIQPNFSEELPIYLSVFGLEAIAAVKTKLMNECILRRARLAATKNLKGATKDALALLAAGAKTILKGVDSYFGTHVLAANLDPLTLVDQGLVYCLDDIERASSKLPLIEIFGLINYLVEVKGARVLVLTNDEAISKRGEEDAKSFKEFREKSVAACFRLTPDISTVFDRFVGGAQLPTTRTFLERCKDRILHSFLRANVTNLRTLKRSISMLSEVVEIPGLTLRDDLVGSMVPLVIEHDAGTIRDSSFYNFRDASLLFKLAEGDEQTDDRRKYLDRYFGGISYTFVQTFYEFVATGIMDPDSTKNEIDPQVKPGNAASVLMSKLTNDGLYFSSSVEISSLVSQTENILRSGTGLTANQVVLFMSYLEVMLDWLGQPRSADIGRIVRGLLAGCAARCDESFVSFMRYHFTEHGYVAAAFFEDYRNALSSARAAKIRAELAATATAADIATFYEMVEKKPDGLDAAFQPVVLQAVASHQHSNSRFFAAVVQLIRHETNAYRGSTIVSQASISSYDSQYGAFLTQLKNALPANDPMAIKRIDDLLAL